MSPATAVALEKAPVNEASCQFTNAADKFRSIAKRKLAQMEMATAVMAASIRIERTTHRRKNRRAG
jgi:hypothetical protein